MGRSLGTVLFLVGIVVAGTFAARVVPPQVPEGETAGAVDRIEAWGNTAGPGFAVGAILMIAGVVLVRVTGRVGASLPAGKPGYAGTPDTLLVSIIDRLGDIPLNSVKQDSKVVKEALDQVLEELVPNLLDGREALIARLGLSRFAEMMSSFAVMERNSGRAWSALIDECYDEVPECVERARGGAAQALAVLTTEQEKS